MTSTVCQYESHCMVVNCYVSFYFRDFCTWVYVQPVFNTDLRAIGSMKSFSLMLLCCFYISTNSRLLNNLPPFFTELFKQVFLRNLMILCPIHFSFYYEKCSSPCCRETPPGCRLLLYCRKGVVWMVSPSGFLPENTFLHLASDS